MTLNLNVAQKRWGFVLIPGSILGGILLVICKQVGSTALSWILAILGGVLNLPGMFFYSIVLYNQGWAIEDDSTKMVISAFSLGFYFLIFLCINSLRKRKEVPHV